MTARPDVTAAPTTLGERARAVRLGPLASQRAFGTVLDTLARPGSLARLEVPPGVPAALVPADALADVEVSLAVLEGGGEDGTKGAGWADAVHAVTGAAPVPARAADMVVALRGVTADEVLDLRRGTAYAPEQGARLILAVERLHADGGGAHTITGPGVPGERRFGVDGLDPAVLAALNEVNADYPAGVDVHLVAADGALLSIPRSARVRIDEGFDEEKGH